MDVDEVDIVKAITKPKVKETMPSVSTRGERAYMPYKDSNPLIPFFFTSPPSIDRVIREETHEDGML